MHKLLNIYLAGGVFNVGERHRNALLAKELRALGFTVIVPQEEAGKFLEAQGFNLKRLADDCLYHATFSLNMFVGCIDGADADSGTAVEYGAAIAKNGRALVYRTDFRTDTARELGVNAMFNSNHTIQILFPCYNATETEIMKYYKELAHRIGAAIDQLCNNPTE